MPKNVATSAIRRNRPRLSASVAPSTLEKIDSLARRTTQGNRSRAIEEAVNSIDFRSKATLQALEMVAIINRQADELADRASQVEHLRGRLLALRRERHDLISRLRRNWSRLPPKVKDSLLGREKRLAAAMEDLVAESEALLVAEAGA